MAAPFFFIPSYNQETVLEMDEPNSRHMVAVLRMEEGEEVRLTDGKGNLLWGRIQEAHKKRARVHIYNAEQVPGRIPRVSLAISPVKNTSRFEWLLEKATEIGVGEIYPLISQRTEKQQFRWDRMHQILVSALLQSQQAWLPELHQPTRFAELLNKTGYDQKWIAHCMEGNRKDLTSRDRSARSPILLIGPEGDFSPEEVEAALKAGFEPVTLGETRLRTETAGMVGVTLLCIG